ncbi:MAG: nucleotidyl transferase AbiEii/AbiGii toxin family protein [Ignavibacteriae bacterium]|nr:nucleotidyl transferase AbiEii/AbiGii toxin family protein [Ignavibacteriota bacterium]
MTEKEFTNKVTHSSRDFLGEFLALLNQNKIHYCVIGGLAVNAYAEPVVSLDLDIIIATSDREKLLSSFSKDYSIKEEKHSINISVEFSDLRIQIQTDSRYQEFIRRTVTKKVLGYELSVASLEDVLRGKLWAYSDPERRESKRQKDLADILRLVESHPELKALLPLDLQSRIHS